MPERGREAVHRHLAGLALGREPVRLEVVARLLPQFASGDARAHGRDRGRHRLEHELVPAHDLAVGLAGHERARDVGEAGGRAILRPEVDDHGLARRDRPAPRPVAAGRGRPVGDGVLAERDLRPFDRVAHQRGERFAGQVEHAVAHRGGAQRVGGRGQARLGGARRAPDPGQLGLGLAAPAVLEQRPLDVQLDPRRAQRLGGLEREVRRHGGTFDAQLTARADADLEQRHVPRPARRDQLAQAEVGEQVEPAQVGPRGGDHVRVQRRDRRERLAIVLAVEERVHHGHRNLVAQLGERIVSASIRMSTTPGR